MYNYIRAPLRNFCNLVDLESFEDIMTYECYPTKSQVNCKKSQIRLYDTYNDCEWHGIICGKNDFRVEIQGILKYRLMLLEL